MHYRGILDDGDLEWYEVVLKECKSLDVNDFLHNISPYVTNRPLPPICATATVGGQGALPPSAPPIRLIEIEIFHDSHKKRFPQYPDINSDELDMGTSFGQGGGGFNQFGSIERALSGSNFLSNPEASSLSGSEPKSSSQRYDSQ